MARLISKAGGHPQQPAGRAPVPMGWGRSDSPANSGMCEGRSGSLALLSRKETGRAQDPPRKPGTSLLVQGTEEARIRQAFLNLMRAARPFCYLHSRGKDFYSIFARHSDDDGLAWVPGRAGVVATDPATVGSSTGVSWLCHLTTHPPPPRVAKRPPGYAFFTSASCWQGRWRSG